MSMLHQIRIASPCSAAWDQMRGDDRVRHCDQCNQQVYNLSAMTSNEVAVVLASEKIPCVRFYRRGDGTVLTRDCRVGRVSRIRRAAVLAASWFGLTWLAGCQTEPEPQTPMETPVSNSQASAGPTCVMGEPEAVSVAPSPPSAAVTPPATP